MNPKEYGRILRNSGKNVENLEEYEGIRENVRENGRILENLGESDEFEKIQDNPRKLDRIRENPKQFLKLEKKVVGGLGVSENFGKHM